MTTLPTPATGKRKRNSLPLPSQDMTPLVDLGFLLISFFIFTTSLSEKKMLPLVLPGEGAPAPLGESRALTVLLGKQHQVFVYSGRWEKAAGSGGVRETSFDPVSGLGFFIRKQQQFLRTNRDKLMLLIKPTNEASYQDLVAAMDAVLVNHLQRYAILPPTQAENAVAGKDPETP